jgi:hypothetical protein
MAARDKYAWESICPQCGRIGAAQVSEEAFPLGRRLGFAVDDVSLGFEVQHLGKSAADTVIVCLASNAPA